MTDRHYNEDEVAAIFRAATEGSESRALPDGRAHGLTLHDLQDIAREVGISPSAVSRAAQSLDRPNEMAARRTFLGLPIAVERRVALNRNLTDTEWDLLVVELREVFHARGTVRTQGSLREWSNGNLHALLEPTPTGYQLRLGTFKGDARASVAVATLTLGMSVVVGALAAANGTLSHSAPGIAALATIGVVFLANGVLRLPRWARLRRRQMDDIVERLTLATQDENGSQPQLNPG